MIVADTNLVAYLLTPGERTEAAESARVRDPEWVDPEWVAPPLWRSELRSVLVQHLRAGSLDPTTALAAWTDAEALLRVGTMEPDTGLALHAALERGLSAYHAEFVSLAETLSVPLVTDDRRVLKACPDIAVAIDAFAEGAGSSGADTPGR